MISQFRKYSQKAVIAMGLQKKPMSFILGVLALTMFSALVMMKTHMNLFWFILSNSMKIESSS